MMLVFGWALLATLSIVMLTATSATLLDDLNIDPSCSCTCSVPVCANTIGTSEPSGAGVQIPSSSPTTGVSQTPSISSTPTESMEPTMVNTISIPVPRPTLSPV